MKLTASKLKTEQLDTINVREDGGGPDADGPPLQWTPCRRDWRTNHTHVPSRSTCQAISAIRVSFIVAGNRGMFPNPKY